MVFIVHDFGRTTLENGFRAVEGLKPIKLPEAIGVMDSAGIREYINISLPGDWEPTTTQELNDLTTFSIIFSPSGKLVIHDVRAWNRDGAPKWPELLDNSEDDVFNAQSRVTDPVNPVGVFIQDDYLAALGLKEEPARNSFIIYDRKEFRQAYEKSRGYSDCLVRLVPIYINPYTGTMISAD
jgi:hypothetical protein